MWRIARAGGTARLVVEMFRDRVIGHDRDAIVAEGLRMLAFADPASLAEVPFGRWPDDRRPPQASHGWPAPELLVG
jgi:hypothetical protein